MDASDDYAVSASHLHKEYSGGVTAVQDSSFDVESGTILGIIGPNGSGKTTTLKMLSGLIEPTSGSATVAGRDSQESEMRYQLGFLPEDSPLYEDMGGVEYLQFFADLYDVSSDDANQRIHDVLDRLSLEQREVKIGTMSKGMRRKIAIARSLVNDPEVLVYDEPASGLDPLSTRYIIEFIRQLRDEGKTVVLSNHNLYHVADICDRVLMMLDGDIVAEGTLEELHDEFGETQYTVYSTVPVEGSVENREGQHSITVTSMPDVREIESVVESEGGEISDIRTTESSLEDIFVKLASR